MLVGAREQVDLVMRVEVQDVAFPALGSRPKDAGLTQMELSVKCCEVDDSETDQRSGTA